MRITEAIDGLSKAELRSSEAYLRAALASGELEERQFFIDMAKEELKHARTLLEMAPQVRPEDFELSLSAGELEAVGKTVDEALRAVARAGDPDRLFLALARMERGELNSIYESLLHLDTNHLAPGDKVEPSATAPSATCPCCARPATGSAWGRRPGGRSPGFPSR